MNLDVGTAMILLAGLVGVNVVGELVKLFFQRMRTSDYVSRQEFQEHVRMSGQREGDFVTVKDCTACEKRGTDASKGMEKKVDAMARLVLAMAVKMGIDVKEIQELM